MADSVAQTLDNLNPLVAFAGFFGSLALWLLVDVYLMRLFKIELFPDPSVGALVIILTSASVPAILLTTIHNKSQKEQGKKFWD